MGTTIQVSGRLVQVLKERKMSDNESYEEIIWDLLEDSKRLSAKTLKEIGSSRKAFAKGNFVTIEKLRKESGL
ncbi:MAG: hypothetical protein V1820_01270 [archaeon]